MGTIDFQHFGILFSEGEYDLVKNEFNSSFWIKRKWFFTHQYYRYNNTFYVFFYSQIDSSFEKIALKFIRHIIIVNNHTTIDLRSSQLTLSTNGNLSGTLFIDDLNCIIPFEQLKKLTVTSKHFQMDQLIELLYLCSNVELLTLSTYSSTHSSIGIRNNNHNNTQQIIINGHLTFEDVQELLNTFPNLKFLEMNIIENDLESIIRFLLKYNINQNRQLCLIGIRDAHSVIIKRLQKFIHREQLVNTYSIELLSGTLFLR